MQYTLEAEESGDPMTPLFTVPEFQQRLLRFDGAGEERRDDERDEVLYVLEGSGVATVDGTAQTLGPGTGVFVARGTPWQIEHAPTKTILTDWYGSLPKARAATADGTAMRAVERAQAHDRGGHAEVRDPYCGRC